MAKISISRRSIVTNARVGIALIVAALLIAGAILVIVLGNPGRAYEQMYTQPGQCLDNTPFDPDNGAMLHQDTVNGTPVLIVIPVSANSYKPSVLAFSAERYGFSVSIAAADVATKSALAEWCNERGGF